MFARTPRQRDHLAEQWGAALAKADRMREWAATATPEERQAASTLGGSGRRDVSFSYEQVKAMAERPLQTLLPTLIRSQAPLLFPLDLAILTAVESSIPFITSDAPCVWFDPEGYKRPPLYQGPALMYETIEITLPVSPRQCVLLNRRGVDGYRETPDALVDEYNRRTRFHCVEYIVTNSSATRPIWFDNGTEPEDSWRKRHPTPAPCGDASQESDRV
jgi:hypothetical protein